MLDKIFRLNHDSFRLEGEKIIYTDPFHLHEGEPTADIILISHEHFDHCSPEDIQKIAKPTTTVVAIASCMEQLLDMPGELSIIEPGDRFRVQGVDIQAVPAYNTDKDFHPRASGHVGYIFTLKGKRIYFAGDTDHIPEMKDFKVDIALLPVSGTYVMTAEQAVGAADDIAPELVIPMHYDDIVGTKADAERFAKLYKGKTVIK